MNYVQFAIPGLMPPTAPKYHMSIDVPEDGSLKLCIHCGKYTDDVHFVLDLWGYNGGLIKDPSYNYGPLETSKKFLRYKKLWAQFMYTSDVLPEGFQVLNKLVCGDVPVPITETPYLEDSEKSYWLLELPAFTLPPGQTELQIIVNNKLERKILNRRASYAMVPNDIMRRFVKYQHQKDETSDVMLRGDGTETIEIPLAIEGSEPPAALPECITTFRASCLLRGKKYDMPCAREGDMLIVSVPEMPAGKGVWRVEYNGWDQWSMLTLGDIVIVSE